LRSGRRLDFVNPGATGCEVETVRFANFTILPGQTIGTPIDPAQVQVTPGGTALFRMFSVTLNRTTSIGLTRRAVTCDAALTLVLDVCPDGWLAGGALLGRPTSPAGLVVFAIDQRSLLSDSANFPVSNAFDVFVDLTIDGGRSDSAASAVRRPGRAMHELYLVPFEMAIRDGIAATVMCARSLTL
jgi:hypothetical protein